MSSAGDKARFYLEQSVPELKEYERKKIFTPAEISTITKKRSEFEHKINARGSVSTDYTRYAELEINVDALRRKRIKRLGIRSTNHNGQRRIFFIFDRGTRKFPGDVGLWLQSIEYAKKHKAYKKLSQILTNVLRLHPTKPELWMYAAQLAMEEHADMTEARGYMQRGLRFCKGSKMLWLNYAKLELGYIAKITARRRILGVGEVQQRKTQEAAEFEDTNADVIPMPALTEEDINPKVPKHDEVDQVALQHLASSPAMSGAIPIIIFDSAMSEFNHDPSFALEFYDLVAKVDQISCLPNILGHIVQSLMTSVGDSWQARLCHLRVPVVGMSTFSPEFPQALGVSLERLQNATMETQPSEAFSSQICTWLESLLGKEGLDPALHRVIKSKLASLKRNLRTKS